MIMKERPPKYVRLGGGELFVVEDSREGFVVARRLPGGPYPTVDMALLVARSIRDRGLPTPEDLVIDTSRRGWS